MKSMTKKLCLLAAVILMAAMLTSCGGPVPMKDADVGSYVTFGVYEQDNNLANGKEPIEWRVLDKKEGYLLLISRYALDYKPYHEVKKGVTWGSCSLREWLNNDFLNAAFTSDEQALIPVADVYAYSNPDYRYDANPGGSTEDQVFLLSIQEAEDYMFTKDRSCKATAYAQAQGATIHENGNCWWWLRTPGNDQDNAAIVTPSGEISHHGDNVASKLDIVRPALWVKIHEQP